ncbi:penicillin-binding protein [Salibacterium halotolerans]|uniref:serine-type D-Ala-D-Ala carboxypeptidase n=1 Tax=Salibacterium halotolerans TaxID=1884432 RepID=A0A1I5M4G2_9BACI|nr:penicillin-binding protein [Salibacterium halotolerans]SFP04390.1 penicillin-binding protein 2B [Salibacterium halotolerans]
MNNERKRMVIRAFILFGGVVLFFLVFTGRMVYVQVNKEVGGQNLAEMAESHWTTTQTLEGERGTIYDRNGEPLAEEVQSYTAFAVLDEEYEGHVKNVEKTAEKLAPLIGLEKSELQSMLEEGREEGKFQIELGSDSRYLSLSKKQEIEQLDLEGIHFRTEPKRYYPNQMFASHVLGYTERNMQPKMGLELELNDALSSSDGSVTYKQNRKGVPLWNMNETVNEPKNGDNVHLTLDSNIQTVLEQAMTEVNEKYNPNKMTAIVANAETGEILGMGNRPSFNPNEYQSITNYTNYAVSDRFEPGSTMKMFTLAAAIEEGVYNGSETYQSGTYTVGSRTIGDHNNGEGWGKITYDEGFRRSSNVAFAKVALEKLGPETFFQYLKDFGFSEPTGIDLPNEADSLLAEPTDLNTAITGFGQSSAVTPIQQVQAATAIANDGTMMKPYVVKDMYDQSKEEYSYEAVPESAGSPISESTAAKVRKHMRQVVTSEEGTGQPFQIDGINIAGKTGTAQINDPDSPGYLSGQNKNIFSFMGMAPADDPSIIVYVAVDRPELEPTEAGSAPVSQIFRPVMKQSLSYLNLAPEDVEEEKVYEEEGMKAESYSGKSLDKAVSRLEKNGLRPVIIGSGNTIKSQYPAKGEPLIIGDKVFLKTDGKAEMPDISGWSLRNVKRLSMFTGLELDYVGSGYVTQQSIEAGAQIQKEDYLTVELKKDPSQEETTSSGDEEQQQRE